MNKVFVFITLLFSMFWPLAAFADSIPVENSNDLVYKATAAPVCIVMIVKVDKYLPFIRIIDSHAQLVDEEYISPVNNLTWYKHHLRKYCYESSGGGLPVKL